MKILSDLDLNGIGSINLTGLVDMSLNGVSLNGNSVLQLNGSTSKTLESLELDSNGNGPQTVLVHFYYRTRF